MLEETFISYNPHGGPFILQHLAAQSSEHHAKDEHGRAFMIKQRYRAAQPIMPSYPHTRKGPTNRRTLHARAWTACRFKGHWKSFRRTSSSSSSKAPIVPRLAIHLASSAIVTARGLTTPFPSKSPGREAPGSRGLPAAGSFFFGTVSDARLSTLRHCDAQYRRFLPFFGKGIDQSIKWKRETAKRVPRGHAIRRLEAGD